VNVASPRTETVTLPAATASVASGAAGGLVRLVTSGHTPSLPYREAQQVLNAKRRSLRLFKSISCAGDLLKDHRDDKGRPYRPWFLTFTYRPGVDWEPRHISDYFKQLRRWCERRGCRPEAVWVAEQHKSGRIHYHAIVFLPVAWSLPFPDKSGMWAHGMSQRQEARKGVGYLMKYASKSRDVAKPWPKGCRLHGHSGLEPCERRQRAWWVLPRYIRVQVTPDHRCRRARGGGWTSPETGEWWPSWVGNPSAEASAHSWGPPDG
jgi:hypothetical protein